VNHADLVGLIEGGVTERGGRWADLGAGEGAFTLALADLLGPGAHITAVDRDAGALKGLARTAIETKVADFTRPLGLSNLDGIVINPVDLLAFGIEKDIADMHGLCFLIAET